MSFAGVCPNTQALASSSRANRSAPCHCHSACSSLGVDGIRKVAGVDTRRAERVWAIAQAMLGDPLDAETLKQLDPDAARKRLRELPGIGPFYADLILVRATGSTDVLPLREPRLLALLAELYGERDGEAALARMGSGWSPWRTWVAVLIRAAGPRIQQLSRSFPTPSHSLA